MITGMESLAEAYNYPLDGVLGYDFFEKGIISINLVKKTDQGWTVTLPLKPGKYTYKLIVDGKWIRDPGNELWEENEYNTGNSVLWINR